jgi:hypothetical protein
MALKRHRKLIIVITVVLVIVLAGGGVVVYNSVHHDKAKSTDVVHAPATIADGIAAMTAVTRKVSADEHMSPLDAARFQAYVATAMARAALTDTKAGTAFQQRLAQFPKLENAPKQVDPRVAAVVAGATTARGLVSLPASFTAIAEARDDALAALQPSLPPGQFADALGWGYLVGTSTLAWARADGSALALAHSYTPPTGPGLWRPPPGETQAPLAPHWGEVRPFVTTATACRGASAPVPFSAAPSSAFARDTHSLLAAAAAPGSTGAKRAAHWLDPVTSGSTLGTRWLAAAAEIAQRRHLDPAAATGLYARVALAQADALIATWAEKYRFDRGRPATAVLDSKVRATWRPASTPPPSPEFPGETITVSSAAAQAIGQTARGEMTFPDVDGVHPFWPGDATAFVQQVAHNAVVSGDIFPATIAPSLQLGQCVAKAVDTALGTTLR